MIHPNIPSSQFTSMTEPDPEYDEMIGRPHPEAIDRSFPSSQDLRSRQDLVEVQLKNGNESQVQADPISVFCGMFGDDDGSYPTDFPESLQ
jgi:hypothetical protein